METKFDFYIVTLGYVCSPPSVRVCRTVEEARKLITHFVDIAVDDKHPIGCAGVIIYSDGSMSLPISVFERMNDKTIYRNKIGWEQ